MNKTLILGLLFGVFAANAFAEDSLTIFTYPPSIKIDWSTPRKTVLSLLRTEVVKTVLPSGRPINSVDTWGEKTQIDTNYRADLGHTITHVACTTSTGEAFDRWGSVSGEEFPEIDKENVFTKKMGLGILLFDYDDGHVISGEENINLLLYYIGKDSKGNKVSPRYLQYEISTEQCDAVVKMVKFYEVFHYDEDAELSELRARPKDQILIFSANIDPFEAYKNLSNSDSDKTNSRAGGTCASYGMGLLKVANLYDEELDQVLKLKIDVSEKLIGTSERPVSLSSILLTPLGGQWNYDGYTNKHLENYDPQKIWNFSGDLADCISVDQTSENCKLKDLKWFNQTLPFMSKGGPIQLTSKDGLKTVSIEGIVIKSKK